MQQYLRSDGPQSAGIANGLLALFAIAAGLSVANIYCAQPFLDAMAHDFAVSHAMVGAILTVTQAGYALGLFFLVPLGDMFDRRRLIVCQLLLSVLALVAVALAPTVTMMLCAMFLVGMLATVIQVLVAYAAALASSEQRGSVVGKVTSGVVIGILLSRTAAGALTDLAGWRSVYWVSAGLLLVMAGALWKRLPVGADRDATLPYRQLLTSVFGLWRDEPLLRIRGGLAMLVFATFNVFWSSLALELSSPPFGLSHSVIGSFGFIGVAGVFAAAGAGRLADRGYEQWTTGTALILLVTSWLAIGLLHRSLVYLICGVILLDLAVQAVHVSSQSLLFAKLPEARSRVVAAYMIFYSIGSGAGSFASTWAYAHTGWTGVSLLGIVLAMLALISWAAARSRMPATSTDTLIQQCQPKENCL